MGNKKTIALGLLAVLVIGGAYIVYRDRPVMKLQDNAAGNEVVENNENETSQESETTNPNANTEQPNTPTPATGSTAGEGNQKPAGVYSLADVQKHNNENDCWSTINGNVYDLTSWVSRHPGGPRAIIGLCGSDGTAAYTGKHGTGGRPAAALVLLKIGKLQ